MLTQCFLIYYSGIVEVDLYVLTDDITDSGDLSLVKQFMPYEQVMEHLNTIKENPPLDLTTRGVIITDVRRGATDNETDDRLWVVGVVLVVAAITALALGLGFGLNSRLTTPQW
jgi:hypothetical protein